MSAPKVYFDCKKNHMFCHEMQAASDNIKKQALAEGEEVGKKVLKAMEALQTACDAIDVFMKDNPAEMTGTKKRPIVFAQWLARSGRKNFKVAEEVERPFEKEERPLPMHREARVGARTRRIPCCFHPRAKFYF